MLRKFCYKRCQIFQESELLKWDVSYIVMTMWTEYAVFETFFNHNTSRLPNKLFQNEKTSILLLRLEQECRLISSEQGIDQVLIRVEYFRGWHVPVLIQIDEEVQQCNSIWFCYTILIMNYIACWFCWFLNNRLANHFKNFLKRRNMINWENCHDINISLNYFVNN